MDYLDSPPQRYQLVAARNERGIIELTRPDGEWVKFVDMDLYMLEGGQLLIQSSAEITRLREALESIRQYGSDTLSGRDDGPDDRKWQRAAVFEMTKRARLALSAAEKP